AAMRRGLDGGLLDGGRRGRPLGQLPTTVVDVEAGAPLQAGPRRVQEERVVRVLIAEDMRILRDTLVAVLDLEEALEVVAAVASGDGIIPAALEHRPDVAVLDIDLPVVDGLTAAAELHEKVPSCRILILTGLAQPGQLRRAVA